MTGKDKGQSNVPPRRRLASVKEACTYASISRTKLYMKLGAGIIKAVKRDGKTLVDLNSIDAMHDALPEWTPMDGSKG